MSGGEKAGTTEFSTDGPELQNQKSGGVHPAVKICKENKRGEGFNMENT